MYRIELILIMPIPKWRTFMDSYRYYHVESAPVLKHGQGSLNQAYCTSQAPVLLRYYGVSQELHKEKETGSATLK